MSSEVVDAQFHRAVDIVQSLPKGGPVQTNYEEKLWLCSLYKQGELLLPRPSFTADSLTLAMEGDITTPRPRRLDLLGRSKWDSWNKQKGVKRSEAKTLYVAALLKILKKFADRPHAQALVQELEAYIGASRFSPRRAASPSSSASSYHSSQESGRASCRERVYATVYVLHRAPDPSLPAPDVAPDLVPPSALTSSHRSLLNLTSPVPGLSDRHNYVGTPVLGLMPGSRTHSLVGEANHAGRKDSVYSLRQNRALYSAPSALSVPPEQARASGSNPFSPQPLATPDPYNHHPSYLGIQQTPTVYPPQPGSTSTFFQQPLTIPQTLQQIQTSLTALHERMSTLERTQAMLLRRADRQRGWFWNTEADELDELEEAVERARWPTTATATATRVKRRKSGNTIRMLWFLITALRRAMMDVSLGVLIAFIGVIVFGGGLRRTRVTLAGLLTRARRLIRDR
ncbi:MAG: hypothetical protein TREMPRED_000296 [Tremellales sp. Tagirdzhanova-0007]|nr:MAG: hypothetical protein TREMPRED_000296 [Tremellales sp. Tagirdzhanova-0007]